MAFSTCVAIVLGAAVHTLPTDSITLSWTHTVEKTRWEEDYRIVGSALIIEEARVKTSGAGMEPPRDATWSSGWWRYKPSIGLLEEVILANSEFAPGYTICWANACKSMQEFVPRGEFLKIVSRPCGSMFGPDEAVQDAFIE